MSSKTFASRFAIIKNRKDGRLGVIQEVEPAPEDPERQFCVIWEGGDPTSAINYTPEEVLRQTQPVNGKANKLVLSLIQGSWWKDPESV